MHLHIKLGIIGIFHLLATMIYGQSRPNVILIVTDDQGAIDLNCYGAKDLYTPHLDGLAAKGIRFTQCLVAAPLCSPSRAALLTGKNPHAAGLPHNAPSLKGKKGMPTEQQTLAESLQQKGYTTAHIGKWHLGFSEETMPLAQGFEYSFGHMGGCIDNYSHFFYWNGPNRHDLFENGKEVWADGQYFPDMMTDKAIEFIEEHPQDPFFLYYAINLPHYPLQPTAKWRKWYKDLPSPRNDYAAFISTTDEQIGRLLQTLDSLKIRDNTLIVFLSDHGHSVEQRAFSGGGNAGPYRGAKGSLFEGGIRVPSIVSFPSKIPENQVRDQLVSSMDWMPTILEYCEITPPLLEGRSLQQVIANKDSPSPHDLLYWKQGVSWAVRKGDWKLLGYPNDPTDKAALDNKKDLLFLSNLSMDNSEQTNLAKQYPKKVEELLEAYQDWEYAVPEDIPQASLQLANKVKDIAVEVKHAPHPKYFSKGLGSLVDEQLGSRLFSDGNWLGFESTDLEAILPINKQQVIEEILIGTLQDAGVWIFSPKYIEISWSNDGISFSPPLHFPVKNNPDNYRKTINRISCKLPSISCNYLKIKVKNIETCPTWHAASGQPAWLFVDEITLR